MLSTIIEDRLLRYLAAVGLVVIVVMSIFYISPIHKDVGESWVNWFYDLSVVLSAGLAAGLMLLIGRTFEREEILWWVWFALALGMLLWALGEGIWAYYELILHEETPYPSVADIAYVAGYIPLFIGLFLRFYSLKTMPTRREFVIGGSIFILLLVLAVIFVIGPIVTYEGYSDRTEQFLDVLYPVGDLAVVFAALLSGVVLAGGTLSYPWMLMVVGFLITSVADLLYSYATWNETYVTGSNGINLVTALTDVPYFAAYVVIAFAMFMQARQRRVI